MIYKEYILDIKNLIKCSHGRKKFRKENGISDFDNISSKQLWEKEIPINIDYSRPLRDFEMENILNNQFEFINRNYSKILIDADIKSIVE